MILFTCIVEADLRQRGREKGESTGLCKCACHSLCILHVWSVRPPKHKCLCILWPSCLHNNKCRVSDVSHSSHRPFLFPKADAFDIHLFLFFVSHSLLMSSFTSILLRAALCVCVCVCRVGIPAVPLSSGGIGFLWWALENNYGKLWLFLVFPFPYLFIPPPTLCFLLLVLNSSHSIFFHEFLSYSFFQACILYPPSVFPPLPSAHLEKKLTIMQLRLWLNNLAHLLGLVSVCENKLYLESKPCTECVCVCVQW